MKILPFDWGTKRQSPMLQQKLQDDAAARQSQPLPWGTQIIS
jgi:hypothetical protein